METPASLKQRRKAALRQLSKKKRDAFARFIERQRTPEQQRTYNRRLRALHREMAEQGFGGPTGMKAPDGVHAYDSRLPIPEYLAERLTLDYAVSRLIWREKAYLSVVDAAVRMAEEFPDLEVMGMRGLWRWSAELSDRLDFFANFIASHVPVYGYRQGDQVYYRFLPALGGRVVDQGKTLVANKATVNDLQVMTDHWNLARRKLWDALEQQIYVR